MAWGAAIVPSVAIAAASQAVAVVPLRDGIHSEDAMRAVRDELATAIAKSGGAGVRVLDADALARVATGAEQKELAAKLDEAKTRAEKARAFVRRADFEKSLPEFEAAVAASTAALPAQNDGATFDLLIEWGAALLDLNRTPQAVELFRRARLLGGPNELDPKAHSPRTVAAWKAAVGSLKGKLGAAVLVSSSPGGATVIVNGRSLGTAPLLVSDLADGSHLVRVELAGHSHATARVTATASKTANAHLVLAKTLPLGFERGVDAAASIDEVFADAVDVGKALQVDLLVVAGWVRSPGTETDRLQALVIDVKRELLVEGAFHATPADAATAVAKRVAAHVKETPPVSIPALRVEVSP